MAQNVGSTTKLAEQVAARIKDRVVELGWPVGQMIATEAELLETFKVSRATLREAIRLVEHHRVALMRRGTGGGLVVTEPDVSSVSRAINIYLERSGVDEVHLFDARATLELSAVDGATVNITEDGIAQLREMLAGEAEHIRELEEGVGAARGPVHDVHHAIARMSGNPAVSLFVESLIEMTTTHATSEFAGDRQIEATRELHRAHVKIVDAIVSGDAALAKHRMLRHLNAMRSWIDLGPRVQERPSA